MKNLRSGEAVFFGGGIFLPLVMGIVDLVWLLIKREGSVINLWLIGEGQDFLVVFFTVHEFFSPKKPLKPPVHFLSC